MKKSENTSILPEKVIKDKKEKLLEKYDIEFFFFKLIIIIIVISIIINTIYGIIIVEGQNMYPFIKDGDVALYFMLDKKYNVGDVVVYNKNVLDSIGRIVAKSGDIVDITSDGFLVVNGNEQQEDVFFKTYSDMTGITFPHTVAPDSVFVLGDYRTNTKDSRQYGDISYSDIKGKIFAVYRRRGI